MQFLDRRIGDRVACSCLARPYSLVPLTLDRDSVASNSTIPLSAVRRGTAIGEAIGLRQALLTQPPINECFPADVASHAGVLTGQGSELARDEGVRIHAIAFGGSGGGLSVFGLPLRLPGGGGGEDIDEATLQRIADLTGGRAFRARDTEGLAGIYAEIDRIEPVERAGESVRPRIERYPWPLGVALVFGLLALATQRRTVA